jgi:molybdopterin converting factor small subunit
MATAKKTFVVGFTRLDGAFRHAQVTEGTKLGALLLKFGYAQSEIPAAIRDVRVGGESPEGGENYLLKADDVVAVVPNVKGGKA